MNETEHRLDRYVGHLTEGALRFRNELAVGSEAPDFALPSLDGDLVGLSKFRGKSNVVLIFDSFACGSTVTQLRAGSAHYIDGLDGMLLNSFLSVASFSISSPEITLAFSTFLIESANNVTEEGFPGIFARI